MRYLEMSHEWVSRVLSASECLKHSRTRGRVFASVWKNSHTRKRVFCETWKYSDTRRRVLRLHETFWVLHRLRHWLTSVCGLETWLSDIEKWAFQMGKNGTKSGRKWPKMKNFEFFPNGPKWSGNMYWAPGRSPKWPKVVKNEKFRIFSKWSQMIRKHVLVTWDVPNVAKSGQK
jgi:hypothetical protein